MLMVILRIPGGYTTNNVEIPPSGRGEKGGGHESV